MERLFEGSIYHSCTEIRLLAFLYLAETKHLMTGGGYACQYQPPFVASCRTTLTATSPPQFFPQHTQCKQLLKTQYVLHVGMDPPPCFRLACITCLPQAFTLPPVPRAIFISLNQHKISPFLRGQGWDVIFW
jgi:hypothetical protein